MKYFWQLCPFFSLFYIVYGGPVRRAISPSGQGFFGNNAGRITDLNKATQIGTEQGVVSITANNVNTNSNIGNNGLSTHINTNNVVDTPVPNNNVNALTPPNLDMRPAVNAKLEEDYQFQPVTPKGQLQQTLVHNSGEIEKVYSGKPEDVAASDQKGAKQPLQTIVKPDGEIEKVYVGKPNESKKTSADSEEDKVMKEATATLAHDTFNISIPLKPKTPAVIKFMGNETEGIYLKSPASENFKVSCVREHNKKRVIHNAHPVVWSDKLAESAQTWADHLAEIDDDIQDTTNKKYGENIFWTRPQLPEDELCKAAVDEWYNEVKLYDFSASHKRNYDAEPVNEFTQLVYDGQTREVGVAYSLSRSNKQYVVARYYKKRNDRQLDLEVHPPRSDSAHVRFDKPVLQSYNMIIRLPRTSWIPQYKQKKSSSYQRLESKMKNAFKATFQESPTTTSLVDLRINNFNFLHRASYIGETTRHLHTRVSNHMGTSPLTDEGEENAPEENAKILDQPEAEKMKASPLKESNHALEMKENVLAKRRLDGPVFLPENKRLRIDIPTNLNLEKKENVENTDVESLSPATPVSPYLPQEIPKAPDEPEKQTIPVKVKIEPKKVSTLTKELVLPLKKISLPSEKIKSEIAPSAKKPKVKAEKSPSPKVTKKLPLSSARPESSLSDQKIPKTGKKSPSPKLMSPGKSRSPVIDKPPTPVKKISEKLTVKQESPITSPVKGSPSRKPKSSATVKKENDTPDVKLQENKQPTKKKKKVLDTTDGLKSPRQEISSADSLNTPKLMIKLLPQLDGNKDSSKSSSKGKKSSTSPAKTKIQVPTTPESKTKIKIKTKSSENENIAKPIGKVKLSRCLLEPDIKKEHSKKKKKKKDKEKDKDREKHKTVMADKAEPPIPKIRFKLDPSGESKVVETKPTVAPKLIASSAPASAKQSSIMVETEKVSTSIITETLSNTLDYDPGKAYYCPVCNKQDDGSPMVGCDGCDEWCHWACVGLIAAPPENEHWYCPQCLLRREKLKKTKSKKKVLKS